MFTAEWVLIFKFTAPKADLQSDGEVRLYSVVLSGANYIYKSPMKRAHACMVKTLNTCMHAARSSSFMRGNNKTYTPPQCIASTWMHMAPWCCTDMHVCAYLHACMYVYPFLSMQHIQHTPIEIQTITSWVHMCMVFTWKEWNSEKIVWWSRQYIWEIVTQRVLT